MAHNALIANVEGSDAISLLGPGTRVPMPELREGPWPSYRRARRARGCAAHTGLAARGRPQRQERGQEGGLREGGQGTC